MAKMKSHRGAMKRFKVTGSGKVRRHKAYKSHILTKKTTKRTRHLRADGVVDNAAEARTIHKLLPYK